MYYNSTIVVMNIEMVMVMVFCPSAVNSRWINTKKNRQKQKQKQKKSQVE